MGEKNAGSRARTVNENDGFLNGVLVAELGVQEGAGDKRPIVGRLIPAHVKMVDVDMAEAAHHFHLILNYGREGKKQVRYRIHWQQFPVISEPSDQLNMLFQVGSPGTQTGAS